MEKRHILITGHRGAGKSTLIRRLREQIDLPVCGFITKRLTVADADGMYPIYIHPAAEPVESWRFEERNRIGRCDSRRKEIHREVFNTLGAELVRPQTGHLVVMDELGFMEHDARGFQEAVLNALQGKEHVLAALRDMDESFLNQVRGHDAALCVEVTQENRETLFAELCEQIRDWK